MRHGLNIVPNAIGRPDLRMEIYQIAIFTKGSHYQEINAHVA